MLDSTLGTSYFEIKVVVSKINLSFEVYFNGTNTLFPLILIETPSVIFSSLSACFTKSFFDDTYDSISKRFVLITKPASLPIVLKESRNGAS